MNKTCLGRWALLLAAVLLGGCDYLGLTDIPADTMRARYSAGAHFVPVLGAEVRVKEAGQGPTVLLIHGFASSADTWDGWSQALAGQYHVVSVDMPPFGVTGPLPGITMTPAAYQQFMDALVAALGLQRFDLAGNSLGGLIAWQYTARHPEHVQKLILVDSAGYFDNGEPLPVRLMQLPVTSAISAHFTPRFMVSQNIHDVYGDPSRVNGDIVLRYQDMMRREGNRPAISAMLPSLKNIDTSVLSTIKVPTLIMWGRNDRWIPPADAELFHRAIPGSQLIWYDGLGHIPMEEDPQRTALDAAHFFQAS